jgi:hypothetical protein
MPPLDPFLARTRIAYFSMEIATRPEMHTYSGGLGILAGDTARSCADLELPSVFVTLVSRAGYFRQRIDGEGRQVEEPDPWQPAEWCTPLDAMVSVTIEETPVWIRPWLYLHTCPHGHQIPILLLDTDLAQNAATDRELTQTASRAVMPKPPNACFPATESAPSPTAFTSEPGRMQHSPTCIKTISRSGSMSQKFWCARCNSRRTRSGAAIRPPRPNSSPKS